MASRREAKKARREKRKRHSQKGLARRPDSESLIPGGVGPRDLVLVEPPGFEKMSVVLDEFARPFFGSNLAREHGIHYLFVVAAAAWNIAMMPQDQQEQAVDGNVKRLASQLSPGDPDILARDIRDLFRQMIAHKNAYFSENKRPIHSIDVTDEGKSLRLNVISGLPLQ
jgi:hypothetical protein